MCIAACVVSVCVDFGDVCLCVVSGEACELPGIGLVTQHMLWCCCSGSSCSGGSPAVAASGVGEMVALALMQLDLQSQLSC